MIRRCIDVNVTGAILAAKEAVLRLSTRHGGAGGAIVNISSVAAKLGSPGEYVWYAASKGAIDTLTVGMAKELALEGIRVNAVSPGMIATEIHERSTGDAARVERMRPLIPMQAHRQPGGDRRRGALSPLGRCELRHGLKSDSQRRALAALARGLAGAT